MLDVAAEIYNVNFSPEVLRIWLEVLEPLSDEEVRRGFMRYFAGERFFPKPGDIIAGSGYVEQPENALDREAKREREYLERMKNA